MEFIKISEILSTSHLRNYRDDDLWIDRLSHRYSVVIFCIFAILVTSKAYIGNPIGNKWSILIEKYLRDFYFSVFVLHLKIAGLHRNLRRLTKGMPKHYALWMEPIIFQRTKSIYLLTRIIDIQTAWDIINGHLLFYWYLRN